MSPSRWNPEELPAWARRALEGPADAEAQGTSRGPVRDQPAWPLLVDAAVVSGFLPRDLAPGVIQGETRSEAESSVLRFAETMHDRAGLKWSLNRESRTRILTEAVKSGDLAEALNRTAEQFRDPISRALRVCLAGKATESTPSDLKELEATRTAVSWLTGVPGLTLPGIDKLDREIELRRLLAPMERMTGQSAAGAGPSITHRFFGRKNELEQLRGYVGAIPAASLNSIATRAYKFVASALRDRVPLAVWGVGGAGKTTLISKFVLEHAEAAVSRYPFVFLDFDRTIISARNRVGLIGEMCLQLGTQFEGLTQPMADLRTRVNMFATGAAEAADRDSISRLFPYIQELRSLVDSQMKALESTFEWSRPFLVILDTFEVVQYMPEDVLSLEEFFAALAFGSDGSLWSRLRLIIAGRKQVTTFGNRKTESLAVGALDKQGSVDMLLESASGANKAISDKDAALLVSVVAKATGEAKGGVQPLRLKLLGEIFSKATEDGATLVHSLVSEFQQPLGTSGLAGNILIDGILVRRMIGHVADARVRALADPGLVVRRITAEVIRQVMAPASAKPGDTSEAPEHLDEDVKEPWILSQKEATEIFEAFKREVSLVEIDGTGLRHRADVRQEMLPLIRARRPKRFKALHRLAFEYFLSLVQKNPSDRPSVAEALYHGLWLGESLEELNSLWPKDSGFDPRIDAGEFPEGGIENIFIRAKSRDLLTDDEVSKLPNELALEWVVARVPRLLDQQSLDDRELSVVRSIAGGRFEALDDHIETAAPVARLLYRSGLWEDAVRLINRNVGKREPTTLERALGIISLKRTYLTILAKSPGRISESPSSSFFDEENIEDPRVEVEMCAYAFLRSAREQFGDASHLRRLVEKAEDRVLRRQWQRELRILRLAILCGTEDVRELLRTYLQLKEWFPLDRDLWLNREPDWLVYIDSQAEFEKIKSGFDPSEKGRGLEAVTAFWRSAKERLARAVRQQDFPIADILKLIVFDHSDWVRCLGNALTRALRMEQGRQIWKLLGDSKFIRTENRRAATQHAGLELVRSVADEGRLLELARALPAWKEQVFPTTSLARDERFSYPRDVFDLADALVKWHTSLLDITSPPQTRGRAVA